MRHARRASLPLVVRGIVPAGTRTTRASAMPYCSDTAAPTAAIAAWGSDRLVPAARSATTTSWSPSLPDNENAVT